MRLRRAGATRAKGRQMEALHQKALIEWANLHPICAVFLFAVGNGGLRTKATGALMKALGVRAGVWDLFLALPSYGAPGLWIEMKAGKNKLTKEQALFGEYMRSVGYSTIICYSCEEAITAIEHYLNGLNN